MRFLQFWRSQFAPRVVLGFLALVSSGPTAFAQTQQFRAAWADIFHVGMASASQVDTMVASLVSGRYNAVIVQVLGYMDNGVGASHGAHWKSTLVPWSSRVTVSFDPLAYLCTKAHASGIQVHAWLGGSGGAMYRVSTIWPPPGNSILAAHPEWMMVPQANSEANAVVAINGNFMLDMGSSDAQDYIISIVRELVTNYPIDGIHWDDEMGGTEYSAGVGFPAYSAALYSRSGLARYRANTGYVGTPSATDAAYGNYRRRFKNELIARAQAEIQWIKTNPRQPLRHTSATMAYGGPPGTCTFTSEEAYTYYSDWPTMLQKGWLDAAIPMNYKTSGNDGLYTAWCDRAYSCWRYNRHIYMGLGAYLNPMSYTVTQLRYAFDAGLNGAATYSYGVPSTDAGNWWTYAAANIYTNSATVPTMPWRNPATATEGIMWGRVKNAQTGAYIDDATVTVVGGPTVQTDGNGYYVATLVPATQAGTVHSTTASETGLISQTTDATVLAGDIVRYDFNLNVPVLAPTGLTAASVSSSRIDLAWTNRATNATAVVVARSTVSGGPYGDIAVLGTNATTYSNIGLSPSTTYYYVVRATNGLVSSVNSSQATATTSAPATPPEITAQPQNLQVNEGEDAAFAVAATGTAPLYFQWQFNSADIAGATSATYVRSNAQPPDAGSYSVVVSNLAGTTNSASAALIVIPFAPTMVQQPQSRAAVPGGYAEFHVGATGTEITYQWQRYETNLAGETSSSLQLSNVSASDFGPYRAIVANTGGAATSAVAELSLPLNPTLLARWLDPDKVELSFPTEFGPIYAVDFKAQLDDPTWTELARTNGTGSPQTVTDFGQTNASRFYRLQLH